MDHSHSLEQGVSRLTHMLCCSAFHVAVWHSLCCANIPLSRRRLQLLQQCTVSQVHHCKQNAMHSKRKSELSEIPATHCAECADCPAAARTSALHG